MSSPKESNEGQLKGGHAPAVKVGGMRVTQHKTPKEPPGISEDITGLKMGGSPPKVTTISGAIPKEIPQEAVQNMHKEKPPVVHSNRTPIHIQQPRK